MRVAGAALVAAALAAAGVSAQRAPAASSPAPASAAAYDVTEKSIEALQHAMQSGEVTSRRLVDLYRDLLAGRVSGREVWSQLKALNRVGVTRGTLEERRDPLAIV